MSSLTQTIDSIRPLNASARDAVAPWVERLARVGFVAKGAVYLLLGALTWTAAIGAEVVATDQRGAFEAVLARPLGRVMLTAVAGGLSGYAVWRLAESLLGHYQRKRWSSRFKRAARLASAITYGSLAFGAWKVVVGAESLSSDERARHWTGRMMAQPLGASVVSAAGVCVIVAGIWQLYRAWACKLGEHVSIQANPTFFAWALRFGRFGLAARGIVFLIVGIFLMIAAERRNADEARGVSGALRALEQVSYGPWVLGAMAVGLMAYGLFQLFEARYRRIMAL